MAKKRKRIIKRRSVNEREMGRGVYVCRVCYPDRVSSMPYTIYTKTIGVRRGKSVVKILMAWCAECQRWLAEKDAYFSVKEKIDVAASLSDGIQGKGLMSWERWCSYKGVRG